MWLEAIELESTALEQWFSTLSAHQNHLESLWKQIDGPTPGISEADPAGPTTTLWIPLL